MNISNLYFRLKGLFSWKEVVIAKKSLQGSLYIRPLNKKEVKKYSKNYPNAEWCFEFKKSQPIGRVINANNGTFEVVTILDDGRTLLRRRKAK